MESSSSNDDDDHDDDDKKALILPKTAPFCKNGKAVGIRSEVSLWFRLPPACLFSALLLSSPLHFPQTLALHSPESSACELEALLGFVRKRGIEWALMGLVFICCGWLVAAERLAVADAIRGEEGAGGAHQVPNLWAVFVGLHSCLVAEQLVCRGEAWIQLSPGLRKDGLSLGLPSAPAGQPRYWAGQSSLLTRTARSTYWKGHWK